jgi:hypothetical protein
MEICDSIGNYANAEQVSKALLRRLADSDPKVVSLSLVLAETCMKNAGNQFAGKFQVLLVSLLWHWLWLIVTAAVNQQFMDEMANIGKGRSDPRNAEDALRLIQQWGRQFEQKRNKFPIFFDTFVRLRAGNNLRYPWSSNSYKLLWTG